jgi:hypothetical protein
VDLLAMMVEAKFYDSRYFSRDDRQVWRFKIIYPQYFVREDKIITGVRLNRQSNVDGGLLTFKYNGSEATKPIFNRLGGVTGYTSQESKFFGCDHKVDADITTGETKLLPGQALPSGVGFIARTADGEEAPSFGITAKDILRYERIMTWINSRDGQRSEIEIFSYCDGRYPQESFRKGLKRYSNNIPIGDSFMKQRGDPNHYLRVAQILSASMILPITYGGIHLTAWNFEFPTYIEKLLWQISCFIIMGSLPAVGVFLLLAAGVAKPFEHLKLPKIATKIPKAFFFFVVGLMMLAYAASRAYVIVESFISLRHLPIGAYVIPTWVQVIPHL